MKNSFSILKRCPLFKNISSDELSSLLTCLNAKEETFEKNANVFPLGAKASKIGIINSGSVNIIKNDFWGNSHIMSHIEEGDVFAEAFACSGTESFPFDVICCEKTKILFVDYNKAMTVCSSTCEFHARLIKNLAWVLASKNILLTQKMDHLSKRTTREKLLSYLSECAKEADDNTFIISFNRQQLADFLCVDRSAMSAELSKMQKEGLLEFHKNSFTLHPYE